ncbi:MAG: hypothetical protein L6R38_003498 [Xanthoria sp. 2 TBL-2021]|nr:MAG: hypothetical protein L6R38_003498 [Xanthoria sp. 2 TBL-2021]
MGKSDPAPRKGKKVAQTTRKPVDARVSYLYRAAKYFAGIRLDNQSNTTGPGLDPLENHQISTTSTSGSVPVNSMALDDQSAEVTREGSREFSSNYDKSSIRTMLSHLKGISKKGSNSVPSAIKRSICKRCNLLLIDGRNSSKRLENKSRGAKKPWADVLAVTCHSCGTAKRFPVGAKRQPRRNDRLSESKDQSNGISTTIDT